MPTGISNKTKGEVRSRYAEGRASRSELLAAEAASYHSPGTCTFYGTANSNQMLMEFMGLHIPGAAFVNPGTALRDALTSVAATRAFENAVSGQARLFRTVDEKALVNGIVGLLATGGSTNHTIHLIAIARAAGLLIDWDDFDALSTTVPLLARVYPNGNADVNQFQAAGGLAFVIRELLAGGLLHEDVQPVFGDGLTAYSRVPYLNSESTLEWRNAPNASLDLDVVRPLASPFSPNGGLRTLRGNLGRSVIKTSAVAPEHRVIEGPARVFESQDELIRSFQAGELTDDFVAVVRFQGPSSNGMPELHKLTPTLTVLQNRGIRVALVSDGRMSGASGKVPAAIHLTPEAAAGGPIARVRDGDWIKLDAENGTLEVEVDQGEFASRLVTHLSSHQAEYGLGRELFARNRASVSTPETGAISIL